MDALRIPGKPKFVAKFNCRLICKQRVSGSNPLVGSRFRIRNRPQRASLTRGGVARPPKVLAYAPHTLGGGFAIDGCRRALPRPTRPHTAVTTETLTNTPPGRKPP